MKMGVSFRQCIGLTAHATHHRAYPPPCTHNASSHIAKEVLHLKHAIVLFAVLMLGSSDLRVPRFVSTSMAWSQNMSPHSLHPLALPHTDGTITTEEFIIFYFHMKSGHKSSNPVRVHIARLTSYWFSVRTKTVKTILISHLQLTSSLTVSFPSMYLATNVLAGGAESAYSSTDETNTAVSGIFASVQNGVQPVFDVASNLNIQVVEFIGCAVGPRQAQRLSFSVGLLLCLIGVPWFVALVLQLLSTIKACRKSLTGAAHATTTFATITTVKVSWQLAKEFVVPSSLPHSHPRHTMLGPTRAGGVWSQASRSLTPSLPTHYYRSPSCYTQQPPPSFCARGFATDILRTMARLPNSYRTTPR